MSQIQHYMNRSAERRRAGDAPGEREAIDSALATDPYFLPAHLQRAEWIERHGRRVDAAAAYRHMLTISPPDDQWPPELRPKLVHARDLVEEHADSLGRHLHRALDPLLMSLPGKLQERWNEAIAIRAGHTKPHVSNSNQLHVPRLPAEPFFERREFPFLEQLEAATGVIRRELQGILDDASDGFVPYISYRKGDPVNQWSELNHSDRWSALHLWQSGSPVQENLDRCPETARIMSEIPLADIDGLCPNVLFSALAPHTHIPPHHGETNARLVAHLPLVVPEGCLLRVGSEERQWLPGNCLVFDDTLLHEARNDSAELRVVLIFDLANPLLTATEHQLVSELAKATRAFGAD